MPDRIACPNCAAPCYVTDAECLSCGLRLDEGQSAELAPPPPPHSPTSSPLDGRSPRSPDSSEPLADPPTFAPLLLLAGVTAAGWGTVKLIRLLWSLAQKCADTSEASGGFAALLVVALIIPCLALLAALVPVLLGQGWARIVAGIMHGIAAVLVVPWASGQHWTPPLLWVLGLWATLIAVLFLPSTGRYCRRVGNRECSGSREG